MFKRSQPFADNTISGQDTEGGSPMEETLDLSPLPGLIMLDLKLPKKDGHDEQVRQRGKEILTVVEKPC